MEKRVLLAFAGKMYTGKDTSADIWEQQYHQFDVNWGDTLTRGFVRAAFASRLKHTCREIFNLTDEDVNTPEGKKRLVEPYGKTVRELLQGVGQALREYISKDIWVTLTLKDLDVVLKTSTSHILVTDVRYPNELAALKSRGFTMIKMIRNTGVVDNHASEQDLNDELFDYIIDNNGTKEDLKAKLLSLPEYQFPAPQYD